MLDIGERIGQSIQRRQTETPVAREKETAFRAIATEHDAELVRGLLIADGADFQRSLRDMLNQPLLEQFSITGLVVVFVTCFRTRLDGGVGFALAVDGVESE